MSADEDYTIDQFLTGKLPEKAATAFAAKLQADEALRQRVALRRGLSEYLEGDEPTLEAAISAADKEYYGTDRQTESEKPGRYWWWLLLVGLSLIGGSLWYFFTYRTGPEPDTQKREIPVFVPNQPDTPSAVVPLQDSVSVTIDCLSTPSLAPASAPKKIPEGPEKQTQPVPKNKDAEVTSSAPPAFAALSPQDFAPNPELENIIFGELRAANTSFSLSLPSDGDTIRLAIDPTLKLTTTAEKPGPIELVVFDNEPEKFQEDRPIIRQTISAWQSGTTEHSATFSLAKLPKAGRYYLLLLNQDGDIVLKQRLLVR